MFQSPEQVIVCLAPVVKKATSTAGDRILIGKTAGLNMK